MDLGEYESSTDDDLIIPMDVYTAASLGNKECVQHHLERFHTEVDEKNKGGWTSLMYAAYCDHESLVGYLLECGANPNKQNLQGHTPLILAAMCGNDGCAKVLLQNKGDIDKQDYQGSTALFHAASCGHHNTVKFLLNNKAQVNLVETTQGLTPLMAAASAGHKFIVSDLLEFGADRSIKSLSGDTSESMAYDQGHHDIVKCIEEYSKCKPVKVPSIRDGPEAAEALRLHLLTGNPSSPALPTISPQPSSPFPQPTDLCSWLEMLGLSKYYQLFEDQDIDLNLFLTLEDSDLKEIGINLMGPRKKMLLSIARWHNNIPAISDSVEMSYVSKLCLIRNFQKKEIDRLKCALAKEEKEHQHVENSLLVEQKIHEEDMKRIQTLMACTSSLLDRLRSVLGSLSQFCHHSPTNINPSPRYHARLSLSQPLAECIQSVNNLVAELSVNLGMLRHAALLTKSVKNDK